MRRAERALCLAGAGLLAGAAFVGGPAPAGAADIVLKMAVPDWPPTRIMKDLPTRSTRRKSGNNVKLEADFIPWPDLLRPASPPRSPRARRSTKWRSRTSQWLGAFVEGGYYMQDRRLHRGRPGLADGLQGPAPERGLRPTRPIPTSPTTITASRRCRTCWSTTIARTSSATPTSSRPSRPSTARSCPAPARRWTTSTGTRSRPSASSSSARRATSSPASRWTTTSTASSTRPARPTTSATMQINGFIWQHGGNIWDETKAPKGQAEGVVNSPEAVKALEHYLSLIQVHAAGRQDRHHGHLQDRRAVPRRQGRDEHRVDRLCREHDQPADLEGRRQGRLRPDRRACAAPTASSSAGRISAASLSC